jgi:TolA-binding protein
VRGWATGVEPEGGEMDPRLAKALNAFGAGRYDECRTLAQALISASSDPSTRAECVGLIILSHLDQDHFDAAREAAERLRSVSPDVCQDLLPRVNRDERDYNAEAFRLQHIVATTTDPAEAARAQLWTAHAHQRVGRLELATQSCSKVIQRYPKDTLATQALVRIADIHSRQGRAELAEECYWRVIHHYPRSVRAAHAVGRIAGRYRREEDIETALGICEQVGPAPL